MQTLKKGLLLQNELGIFKVIRVQKNRVIATVMDLKTGKISTHTSEEFNKYFLTLKGEKIIDENKD